MNEPTPQTDLEEHFKTLGIPAVELGRLQAPDGVHAALLVPDTARIGRGWSRRAGLAGGRLFTPGGGTGRSFTLAGAHSEISMALFPVDLGEHLLQRADQLSTQDRFRIAAYIRAYFGSLARIVDCKGEEAREARTDLAQAAGHEGSIIDDRAALDAALAAANWRPTHDMLKRLGIADAWLRDELLNLIAPHRTLPRGVAVFFLRERAASLGLGDAARAAIQSGGFEILAETALSPDGAKDLRKSTRGGNWGQGPFPVSGGPPTHLFFALDVFPQAPDAQTRARHPLLDNGRTLAVKERIRTALLDKIPPSQRFNPVHSTDSSDEAAIIAGEILGDPALDQLEKTVADRLAQVAQYMDGWDAVAPAGDSFAYLRGGGVLRKLYRPHLADRAAAACALHRGMGSSGTIWGQVLEGSRAAGYVDFTDPGTGFHLRADCNAPSALAAIEHLRRAVQDAETAEWQIDERTLFDSLLYWAESPAPVIIGAEGERRTGGLTGGMSDAQWRAVTGMPRRLFLKGTPAHRWFWRQAVHPGRTWAARGSRAARRELSRLLRLLLR
ncbi:hypothetical protein SAMN04488523_11573 [Sulfitobacter brevis]|uniref:Uncharacterized protein n=1 Tax=Sulfitobacter brevis TaxID=74348 RepID=A0A1I2FDT7_9RHOB|nr:hypothetical protein [Sulfitobacter brevis]SFF03405.1 hypothetical protein SAMN04488523_11573 [Sulfitobacter brevis]